MNNGIAVYAGSFDPPTFGHLWVIEQGSRIFQKLIVAVGTNSEKKYTFSPEERREMLLAITSNLPNVEIDVFSNQFLTDYAKSKGAGFIFKGIRNETDYAYERDSNFNNSKFNPEILTVCVFSPAHLAQISSSFVKGLTGFKNWEEKATQFVPEPVFKKLLEKYDS